MTTRTRPLTVYVAGRDQLRDGVKAAIDIIREAGHEVPFDWTELPSGERGTDLASREREAVLAADILVLVWNSHLLGALLETGMALGQNKPVIVVDPQRDSLFWDLPNVRRTDFHGLAHTIDLVAFWDLED